MFGDGLFETIKTKKSKLLFSAEHYNRLATSANNLLIPLNFSLLQLKTQCESLLEINKLDEAAVRITLTRGSSERGITIPSAAPPNLLITSILYKKQANIYPTLCITDIRRNEYFPLSQLKTLNFLEPILTRQQAIKNGCAEGVMLNMKGAVTETSVGNLFAVINQKIFTPKIEDGLLPGIVRQIVIDIATKTDIPIK